MTKKTIFLLSAIVLLLIALGWEAYVWTQPSKEETEKAEKEAEKIPDPEGIKIYESTTYSDKTGLVIGIKNIITESTLDAQITLPNGEVKIPYLDIGEGLGFYDNTNGSYDLFLLRISEDDKGNKYGIFSIKPGKIFNGAIESKKRDEEEEKSLIENKLSDKINSTKSDVIYEIRKRFNSFDIVSCNAVYGDCKIISIEESRTPRFFDPGGYGNIGKDWVVEYFYTILVESNEDNRQYDASCKVGFNKRDSEVMAINSYFDISINEIN